MAFGLADLFGALKSVANEEQVNMGGLLSESGAAILPSGLWSAF